MEYQIGDKVKIKMDKVLDKYKRFDGIYEIEEIRKTFEGIFIYKLKGIHNWGTEEMIIPINNK